MCWPKTSLLKYNVKPLPGIGQSREVYLEGGASQVLGRGLEPSCRRRDDYFSVGDIVEIVLKPSCLRGRMIILKWKWCDVDLTDIV